MIRRLVMAFAIVAGGCSRPASNSAAKVQRVRVGMTVQQVDGILGSPTQINNPPTLPGMQIRSYSGYTDRDGHDHAILVTFNQGAVHDVFDTIPKKSLW